MSLALNPMPQTKRPDVAQAPQSDREARLAEALRANLKRRKAQARDRATAPSATTPPQETR